MQICKFNITVSTQFLQLYYSLWCPGLQRLQRFDFTKGKNTHGQMQLKHAAEYVCLTFC